MNISAENLEKLNADEAFKLRFDVLQPWSTPVLRTTLPPNVFDALFGLTETILRSSGSSNFGHNLAGEIENELEIPLSRLSERGLKRVLERIVAEFVRVCKFQSVPALANQTHPPRWGAELISAWIVSQRPDEYNPVHYHGGQVSSVIYLKMPEMLPSRKTQDAGKDGSICFIAGAGGDPQLSDPTLNIIPQEAEMYVFGSGRLHTVYPYRCSDDQIDTERRSVSFNANFHEL